MSSNLALRRRHELMIFELLAVAAAFVSPALRLGDRNERRCPPCSMRYDHYRRAPDCSAPVDVHNVERLLHDRAMLRKARDFSSADAVLADLTALGVLVDDEQRSWSLRTWQTPNGNRRERSNRHERERADKARRTKPQKPRVDRRAPYQRSTACAATLSDEQCSEISALVADRLAAKLEKRYADADNLLAQLGQSRVCVSDESREWRADGVTFSADYTLEDGGGSSSASVSAEVHSEVSSLLKTRALAKAARDYPAADALLDQLLDLGVIVDDRRRAWRFVCNGGKLDRASYPGHDYVRLRQSDQRDKATGKVSLHVRVAEGGRMPTATATLCCSLLDASLSCDQPHLELDRRLAEEVDDLLRRRLEKKLAYKFDEADALQRSLNALGVETDERQMTWNVAFAYAESSWRVRD